MTRRIDIEALCADKGLRITEQRKIIARVLGEAEDHPDVETLHARASAIDSGSRSPPSTAPSGCSRRRASSSATIRRRPLALRGRVGNPSRPSDRRRDRQRHRVRRRGARGACSAHRREARLPPRRPPHGAVRRRPRPRSRRQPARLALPAASRASRSSRSRSITARQGTTSPGSATRPVSPT
jgi:hypothetical protein